MARIRRIAQHHHHRGVALDLGRLVRLIGDILAQLQPLGLLGRLIQRIGQIDAQPLIAGEVVGPACPLRLIHIQRRQLHPQLEMRHRVGRHQ